MQCLIPFKSSGKTPERYDNLSDCIKTLEKLGIKYLIQQSDEPFNRAKLLNAAIERCQDDVFFCLDADIIVPEEFDFLVDDVLTKYDIYFPVCMNRTLEGKYKWRHSGLGLVGCRKVIWEQYKLRWNEDRVTWGGEDNDLYKDCQNRNMRIARFWCLGLIHLWHPETLEYKNANALSISSGELSDKSGT